MPKVRKLTADEVRQIERKIKGQRKLVEEEYDAIIGSYSAGDYGEAELADGENRITVRNRLKAAATRSKLALDFKRTKGNVLRFKVSSLDSNGSTPVAIAEPEAAVAAPPRRKGGRPRKNPLPA